MEKFDIKRFQTPNNADKPVYTWEWNGRLTRESIKRQMEDMKRRDIHSFYILPEPTTFRPDTTYSELNVAYLGKEYMEFVRFAAECANELNMTMWLYDEPGWPSGNAGRMVADRDPSAALKWVDKRECLLKAGEVYRPRPEVVATFCTERIWDGFCSEKDEVIQEYFWDSRRTLPRADLMELNATQTFLECTYEPHKVWVGDFFGNLIPCMFTDEPAVLRYPWPFDFAERFEEKYGYDLRDYLPLLLSEETETKQAKKIRIDYYELVSDLFTERYFVTIRDWCHKNNLKFVGHIDRDHEIRDLRKQKYGYLLRVLRTFDVPGIDVILRQIYPDSIPCKEGYGFFPRVASSAAAQNGTKDALSESFAVYGSGMSFDTMRYVLNYQMIRGINVFNFMTMSNREHGFNKAIFNPEMPQSEYYKPLHDYIARVNYLLTLGESEADTALYIPVRDIMADGTCGERAAIEFEQQGYELEKMGIDFDLIDDTVIEEAKRCGDVLEIGLAKYRHIIVPACEYMPEAIRAKLEGISDKVQRSLIPYDNYLRTKTRLLSDNTRLVLIFNESIEDTETEIHFPKASHLYELDLVNGDVISKSYDQTVKFYGGELKAFLLSEKAMSCRDGYVELSKTYAEDFQAAPISAFRIGKENVHKEQLESQYQPIQLGGWDKVFEKEFSGEILYRTELVLPEGEGVAYCIDLGRVDMAARIAVNGKDYGLCTLSPKKLIIPYEEMPKGRVILEITVVNTAANQYIFGDYKDDYTVLDKGPYFGPTTEYEVDVTGGGLYGPVSVSLVK